MEELNVFLVGLTHSGELEGEVSKGFVGEAVAIGGQDFVHDYGDVELVVVRTLQVGPLKERCRFGGDREARFGVV